MDLHLQERVMVKEKNSNKGKEVKVKASRFIKTKRSDCNLIVLVDPVDDKSNQSPQSPLPSNAHGAANESFRQRVTEHVNSNAPPLSDCINHNITTYSRAW